MGTVAGSLVGNPELGLLPWLGTAAGGAIGAGIGSGLNTGISTGNPLAGLASGAASGLGAYAGGQLLGPSLSGIGAGTNAASGAATPGFMGTPIASSLSQLGGQGASDALNSTGSSSLASTVLGGMTPASAISGAVGSGLGTGVAQSAMPSLFTTPPQSPPGFQPSQQSQMSLPGSLSSYANLDPNQQASNIATKGVYGGGNGPQEQNYFTNLINRQLFDQSGNVAANTNSVSPIDMSYLNQLGISGSNPTDLLQSISRFGT